MSITSDLAPGSPPARRGPGTIAVTGLAVGHAVATLVGCIGVLGSTVTACTNADATTHARVMIAGFCGFAAVGLVVWGMLAVRWHRPWLFGAGAVAAVPGLWFAANAVWQPFQYCL